MKHGWVSLRSQQACMTPATPKPLTFSFSFSLFLYFLLSSSTTSSSSFPLSFSLFLSHSLTPLDTCSQTSQMWPSPRAAAQAILWGVHFHFHKSFCFLYLLSRSWNLPSNRNENMVFGSRKLACLCSRPQSNISPSDSSSTFPHPRRQRVRDQLSGHAEQANVSIVCTRQEVTGVL